MDENNVAPKPWEQPASVQDTNLAQAPVEQTVKTPVNAAKKNDKLIKILLAIVISMTIIIGLIFALISINRKTPIPTATKTTTTTAVIEEEDEEPEESQRDIDSQIINAEITDDVSKVITSIQHYQSNNRGAIPTIEISKKDDVNNIKSWQYFFDNYLDYEYTDEDGVKFTDIYQIKVCNFYESTCDKLADLTWEMNKYTIYIATRAVCNNDTSELQVSQGTRHVAVYAIKKPYTKMTKKFICMNN